MRGSIAWWAILCVTCGAALAAPPEREFREQTEPGLTYWEYNDLPTPEFIGTRGDTVWFGGDDGTGYAYQAPDASWDFETPGSNGLQGWTSIDHTENDLYWARVEAATFTDRDPPDPTTPMMGFGDWQIWCGIHQDEANDRDFEAGMGYQNAMCQRAFSPIFEPFDPSADTIDLSFWYFNHTEVAYDYTFIYVLEYDAAGVLLTDWEEPHEIKRFHGIQPVPPPDNGWEDPVFFDEGTNVDVDVLDPSTAKVQIEIRFKSDGGYSDEDGSWDTPGGPFAADEISIDCDGAGSGFYDFESGEQGWTFEVCEPVGKFMHLVGSSTYLDWLDAAELVCGCSISGTALGFVDEEGSPLPWPGMKPGQNEEARSGVVARGEYGPDIWNACVVNFDQYAWYPQNTGAHHRMGYCYYPYTTDVNPDDHWSPRQGPTFWRYSGDPFCANRLYNYTTLGGEGGDPMPAQWDSMKIVFEVVCSCDAFGTDSSECAQGPEGNTNGSPLTDNWRVGLLHVADAPRLGIIPGGRFQDGFGHNYPTYLEPSDLGNSNIARDHNSTLLDERVSLLGDSAVATGPSVTTPETRYLVDLGFRIVRKGISQDMIPAYQQWVARLGADPAEDWIFALMDSMPQAWSGSYNDKFATYYHEDDPRFDTGYEDYTPEQEILPDQAFTPGTQIEWYFRGYWYNDGAPPEEYYVAGPWEYEILPGMRPAQERDENPYYTAVWPSVLYIDMYNRGVEQYLDAVFRQIGIEEYDRYDYWDASS